MCTSLLNRLLNPIDFMCAEIIHYDNITLFQVRNKRLLNIVEQDLSRQCKLHAISPSRRMMYTCHGKYETCCARLQPNMQRKKPIWCLTTQDARNVRQCVSSRDN